MSERGRDIALFLVVLLIADLAGAKVYDRLAPLLVPPPEPVRTGSSLYHHDLRKNVDGWSQWGHYRYRFHTNDLGFRDDRVRKVPLHSNATRVLLLGDSFTEGVGVPFTESFAGILARELAPQGIEVLNAGVVSYSPTIYYRKARYLIEELGLDVDAILVFLDISDIMDEAWLADSGTARVGIGQPETERPPRPLFERIKESGARHSLILKTAARLRLVAQRRLGAGSERGRLGLDQEETAWDHDPEAFRDYGEKGLRRAAEQMDRLVDLAKRHQIPIAIAVYPWPDQIIRDLRDSRQVGFWSQWARTRGAGFIDLFPIFLDGEDPEAAIRACYVPFDIHWSAAGHRRVAEALLQGGLLTDLLAAARERRRPGGGPSVPSLPPGPTPRGDPRPGLRR